MCTVAEILNEFSLDFSKDINTTKLHLHVAVLIFQSDPKPDLHEIITSLPEVLNMHFH